MNTGYRPSILLRWPLSCLCLLAASLGQRRDDDNNDNHQSGRVYYDCAGNIHHASTTTADYDTESGRPGRGNRDDPPFGQAAGPAGG